mgnify:CR=1 FL=1
MNDNNLLTPFIEVKKFIDSLVAFNTWKNNVFKIDESI